MALLCGHLGYVTGMLEYVMTDMVLLRSFAMTGCMLIVGYQVAQPRVLWLSAGWNSVYAMVNLYHIFLLKRSPPDLEEDAAMLYASLGGEARLERWRFQDLLDLGEWRVFEAGARLTEEGPAATEGAGAAGEVRFLASGACDVYVDGLWAGSIAPGGVIGEVKALAATGPSPRSSASVVARAPGARCLCVSLAQLRDDTRLWASIQGVLAAGLAEKVRAGQRDAPAMRYAAVLELVQGAAAAVGDHDDASGDGAEAPLSLVVASGGLPPALAAELGAFGRRHGFTPGERERAAALLALRDEAEALRACDEPWPTGLVE